MVQLLPSAHIGWPIPQATLSPSAGRLRQVTVTVLCGLSILQVWWCGGPVLLGGYVAMLITTFGYASGRCGAQFPQ